MNINEIEERYLRSERTKMKMSICEERKMGKP